MRSLRLDKSSFLKADAKELHDVELTEVYKACGEDFATLHCLNELRIKCQDFALMI